MTGRIVYRQGWTLDDVEWSRSTRPRANPACSRAIKAAALVEFNAPDYVAYLKRVFDGGARRRHCGIEQWGCEESQHGRALGRWAELADPAFDLEEAFARFRAGYQPAHFDRRRESVRGAAAAR